MGCDVHPVICRKDDWGWYEAAIPDDDRNYAFFSILAGVRGKREDTVVPVRGLPTDMDMAFDHDRIGDHSFSWFSLDEAHKWAWEHRKDESVEERAMRALQEWISVMEFVARHWRLKGDEVRVVFGFDN